MFKEITKYYAVLNFKRNSKIQLRIVGKMYFACKVLINAHTFYTNHKPQFLVA